MPLTDIQKKVADVLRPFRTENSYVAGGAALNLDWPRMSDDLDIFNDHHNQLPDCVTLELEALRDNGFSVEITTYDEYMVEVILRKFDFDTKVQWMDEPETCRRFFPAVGEDQLGFQLHKADIAINKVLCASRRQQAPRDAVDLVNIVTHYAPLGPLIWAATGKEPALTPPQILRDIRRIAFGYADEEIMAVRIAEGAPMKRTELQGILGEALEKAREYCEDIAPMEYPGDLFVDARRIPVEATLRSIGNGSATAIPIQDFGITTIIADKE